MIDGRDFYKILGIEHNATENEIKRAYRKLAIKFHPDKNPGNKESENKFKEIASAYAILSNDRKRQEYNDTIIRDVQGNAWDLFDIYDKSYNGFRNIFDGIVKDFVGFRYNAHVTSKKRGGDIKLKTSISLRDAAFGKDISMDFERFEICQSCKGSGAKPRNGRKTCPSCNGTGYILYHHGFFKVERTCRYCSGEGFVIVNSCNNCGGTGRIKTEVNESFKIPSGVENDTRLKFPGRGNTGVRNGESGDAYLHLKIDEHELFRREGNDITCEIPISFTQAALGDNFEVPTLYGKTKVLIPAGTQTGNIIELAGKGMPDRKTKKKGSQFIRLTVVTPVNLTSKEKELLRKLKSLQESNH